MARISNSDLADVFDTDLSTDSLDAWIEIANEITNDVAGVDPSLSSTRLEQIELMLAAHFASAQDPRLSSTSRETASADYQRNEDYATDYMAAAVSLDPTGVVADLDKRTATLNVPDARNIEH
jgi:1,6-anhydro-N-acetylmuramate kinase